MRRTILSVLLLAMVATPCFAEVIEPGGLFSIEGTLWRYIGFEIGIHSSQPFTAIKENSFEMGFWRGYAYACEENRCTRWGSYIDTPVVGIWYYFSIHTFALFAMQPSVGIGVSTYFFWFLGPITGFDCYLRNGIMFKTDDNWLPAWVE